MIALLLALTALQDTTIVIHPDSAALEARALPRLVSEEVIRFYNDSATTRLVGRTHLPHGNEWRGNVAVRSGPVFVGGRVQGTLVVINGDLRFEQGGEVTGDVIVVGGVVDSSGGRISGELRQYREPLLYRLQNEGDQIEYAPNLRRRLPSASARVSWGSADSRSSLTIATGGTFNRVEGLPIVFGPLFDWKLQEGVRLRVDALGVLRSAGDLSDQRSDLGYMFRGELRSGDVRPVALTARATDNLGAVRTSTPVTFTVDVNKPPAVTLTSPATGVRRFTGTPPRIWDSRISWRSDSWTPAYQTLSGYTTIMGP